MSEKISLDSSDINSKGNAEGAFIAYPHSL